jgi:hypothetical protein
MPTIAKFLGVARNSASKIGGVDYFSLGKMTGVQSFDPDAKAYIQRVEGASGDNQILEIGVRYAINDFVVGCKDDGIWTAIKASCIMAGARTLAGALQPLVGTAPTNINFVSGDYDRETGLLGDGNTKYLNSNRNRQDDPQDSQHIAAYVTAAPNNASVNWIFGAGSGAGGVGVTHLAANSSVFVIRHSCLTASSPTGTDNTLSVPNLVGINRASSSSFTYRRNGGVTTYPRASDGRVNGNFFIYSTSPTTNGSELANARLSFYSIGESLDLAKLNTRLSTLMTSIAATI